MKLSILANSNDNTVIAIKDTTNAIVATENMPEDSSPWGVAYDSGKNEIFVSNKGADTVSTLSDTTNQIVETVRVGDYPQFLVYDSTKVKISVTTQLTRTVSIMSDFTCTSNPTSSTASPNPTVPEFNGAAIISVVVAMALLTLCAFTVTAKTRKKL
jgi:YVTN family beta-propeller protein